MSNLRFGGAYALHRDDFANDILVRCPRCDRQALVQKRDGERGARLSCPHCGYNRQTTGRRRFFQVGGLNAGVLPEWSVMRFGGPYDPYFRQELWLNAPVGPDYLWAYNRAHLDLLEQHVAARQRDRSRLPNRNSSIGSRLPAWMSAAQNRKAILKIIERLRATI
ncbi:MAG: hypothetical protein EOO16_02745 [Chitinophagaceae bacterium]|nr:MAG: hypothetical protein EOO16_02745 [Chitinophagaceae bacterium]